jgi:hypothetical protein
MADTTTAAAMLVTVLVVTVVLLLTYRSPVLWLLPLVCAGFAFVLTDALTYLLGRYAGVTVDPGNAAVVTVLVFGVGTDYALLQLARYREELRRVADRYVAMAVALRRAVPAIAASAATVSLGLLCLLAADMGFNHSLGSAGGAGVLCGLLAMTTLLLALSAFLGRWVFWPVVPRTGMRRSGTARPRIGSPMGSGRSTVSRRGCALVEQAIGHLANVWALRRWRGRLVRVRDVYRTACVLICLGRWPHRIPTMNSITDTFTERRRAATGAEAFTLAGQCGGCCGGRGHRHRQFRSGRRSRDRLGAAGKAPSSRPGVVLVEAHDGDAVSDARAYMRQRLAAERRKGRQ